jgi:hypothetical protein
MLKRIIRFALFFALSFVSLQAPQLVLAGQCDYCSKTGPGNPPPPPPPSPPYPCGGGENGCDQPVPPYVETGGQ